MSLKTLQNISQTSLKPITLWRLLLNYLLCWGEDGFSFWGCGLFRWIQETTGHTDLNPLVDRESTQKGVYLLLATLHTLFPGEVVGWRVFGIGVSMCVSVFEHVCLCVCVCVRDRDRNRENPPIFRKPKSWHNSSNYQEKNVDRNL